MKCDVCKSEDHRVLETTAAKEGIRRRRKCGQCGHRWTTIESAETAPLDLEAIRATVRTLETLVGNRG